MAIYPRNTKLARGGKKSHFSGMGFDRQDAVISRCDMDPRQRQRRIADAEYQKYSPAAKAMYALRREEQKSPLPKGDPMRLLAQMDLKTGVAGLMRRYNQDEKAVVRHLCNTKDRLVRQGNKPTRFPRDARTSLKESLEKALKRGDQGPAIKMAMEALADVKADDHQLELLVKVLNVK